MRTWDEPKILDYYDSEGRAKTIRHWSKNKGFTIQVAVITLNRALFLREEEEHKNTLPRF